MYLTDWVINLYSTTAFFWHGLSPDNKKLKRMKKVSFLVVVA
jgi:hypothetical protein